MGRGTKLPTFHADTFKPVVPTENKGIMSGPMRKPKRQGRRMRPRGSRPDVQLGRVTQPDGSTLITDAHLTALHLYFEYDNDHH